MCIVFLSTLATQPLKAQAQETITGNFLAAIPNIGHGLHGLGLGLSRLALDGSQRLAATGNFCAQHYILSGTAAMGALYFYTYIWPQINIDISYSNHRLVHIQNHRR